MASEQRGRARRCGKTESCQTRGFVHGVPASDVTHIQTVATAGALWNNEQCRAKYRRRHGRWRPVYKAMVPERRETTPRLVYVRLVDVNEAVDEAWHAPPLCQQLAASTLDGTTPRCVHAGCSSWDKPSTLMKNQQAHRDAPSLWSSERKMKKRRKKGGSTSPIQKWNHKPETCLDDLRHGERQNLLHGDLDRIHDFLHDLRQTSGSERRVWACGGFLLGQWCPKECC